MPFFGGVNNYRIRGSNNMAGTSAGQQLSTGLNNLLLGNQAGFSVIAGSQNVLAGIGAGSTEELSNVVGIGYGVIFGVAASGAVVIGNQANGGAESVVIGDQAGFGGTGDPGNNIIIGHLAGFESEATASGCVLIGPASFVGRNDAVAIGNTATARARYGLAVGSNSEVYEAALSNASIGAIAFGVQSYSAGVGSIALGRAATVSATAQNGSIAIGNRTVAEAGVVIGTTSLTSQGLDNTIGLQTVAIGRDLTLNNVGATVVIGSGLDAASETETGSVILGAAASHPLIYAPTGGMVLPEGTTAQRSLDDLQARIRYNTETSEPEIFDQATDADWRTVITAILGAAGASAGTLTNAPAAGNPTAWLAVRVGGVDYRIPAWPG